MTYHKGMHSKAMGLLTGVGMIGMGKNKQFSNPYPYLHFTHTCTCVGYPNPCSCLSIVLKYPLSLYFSLHSCSTQSQHQSYESATRLVVT